MLKSESPEPVRVWLLGGFRVSVGSRTIDQGAWHLKKAAALVKLLALSPGHRLHREQVMDVLWPDSGRRAASNSLRKTLHAARRTLGPAAGSRYLVSEDESLLLCPGGGLWIDVETFEEATATARRSKDPAAYRAALDLYAGDLLPEDRYEEWAESRRQELRCLYLSLLVESARLYEERREHERGIEVLRRVVAEEPSNEEAHVSLMRLYALLGREGEALAQYERLRGILTRELGAEPSTVTRRLREDIAAGTFLPAQRAGPPQGELPDAGKHNLPAPRDSFVGRDREIGEVKRALAMTRLLTLTGAGGSGKTRLALEVARDLVGAYPDGVWLVELAPLTEGTLVSEAVAGALGVPERPSEPLTETLIDVLRPKNALLVLDNCEHLIDATAQLADALLDTCPRLRTLVTSREMLNVAGETNRPVSPLSVPSPRHNPAIAELERSESARLFLERGRQRNPSFTLTPDNAQAVAEVCWRLDGVPLAIELAAAQVKALSVSQIAERLEDSLRLLTDGGRTTPERHRTLRGALDWSYELLDGQERVLFRRLSVFAGGWTLRAAEAVGAEDGISKQDVLDLLSDLVKKSLVVAEAGVGGVSRYRMLEPVRQYSQDRLEASEEYDAVRRRHAAFFLALAEETELELKGARQGEWLERLEEEHNNLRAALSWVLGREETELGLRLGGALGAFWYHRGYVREGHRWLEAALTTKGDAPSMAARAKALTWAAFLAWEAGDYERSQARSEEGLRLYRQLGDEKGAAEILHNLGLAALYQMEFERASEHLEEAAMLQRESGDAASLIRTLHALGLVAVVARHDHGQATALYEEGLMLARKSEDNYGILLSLILGALVSLDHNDHRRARALLEEGLELSRQHEMKTMIVFQLHLSASLAGAQQQPVRAARLWGTAEALREALGLPFSPIQHYYYGPYITHAHASLNEEAWETAWAEGRAMSPEEAVEYALSEESSLHSPERLLAHAQPAELTRREEEVAVLVAQGLANRQIAAELVISEHTVATHIGRILKKLGLSSRTELSAWVTKRELSRSDQG